MKKVYHIVAKNFINTKIYCFVAEADLTRINMNLSRKNSNDYFGHHEIYKHSTNILPISKIIAPKYDLKEVIERRMLFHYYKKRTKNNIIDTIIDEAIADSIEFRIEDNYDTFDSDNSISTFKDTKFSNFYRVDFVYQGRKYRSVEQAYLRQKFDKEVLLKLTKGQKEELNEILKFKGFGFTKDDFSTAFYDFELNAGVLKRWSNKLKEWGLESSDWDSKRLQIMTELLILKYTNEEFMSLLLSTGDKYLIEGNDWNDTFWGVCNKRGRNYLGRLIMIIREKILTGQIDKQQITASLARERVK